METTTATATKKKEENTFVRQRTFFSLVANFLVLFFAPIACNPGNPMLKCLSPFIWQRGWPSQPSKLKRAFIWENIQSFCPRQEHSRMLWLSRLDRADPAGWAKVLYMRKRYPPYHQKRVTPTCRASLIRRFWRKWRSLGARLREIFLKIILFKDHLFLAFFTLASFTDFRGLAGLRTTSQRPYRQTRTKTSFSVGN